MPYRGTPENEFVGAFKHGGCEYRPTGSPKAVHVHDFVDPQQGRPSPDGIYDIAADKGWAALAWTMMPPPLP
ncbi:MAG: hypothetical protein KGO02_22160 [Alphaproteobacteria bacterium]|nr:hypothetical protein [Alphaproteobacteria bacterium]